MTNQLVVLVCDTAAKAVEAKKFLTTLGIPAGSISQEQVDNLTYDAQTFDGGKSDVLGNKFVVIGRL